MSQSGSRRSSGRQVRQKTQNRTPLIIGLVAAVVVIAIAAVLLSGRNSVNPAAIGQQIPDTGFNQHLQSPNDPLPAAWNSNPPTSGYHWGGGTAPWGVQTRFISDTITLHNLEHGGVVIHYRDSIDKSTVDQLTTLTRELQRQNQCIILQPRPANTIDTPIVLTAWAYMLKMDTFDTELIRGFFRAHVGRAPEKVCSPLS